MSDFFEKFPNLPGLRGSRGLFDTLEYMHKKREVGAKESLLSFTSADTADKADKSNSSRSSKESEDFESVPSTQEAGLDVVEVSALPEKNSPSLTRLRYKLLPPPDSPSEDRPARPTTAPQEDRPIHPTAKTSPFRYNPTTETLPVSATPKPIIINNYSYNNKPAQFYASLPPISNTFQEHPGPTTEPYHSVPEIEIKLSVRTLSPNDHNVSPSGKSYSPESSILISRVNLPRPDIHGPESVVLRTSPTPIFKSQSFRFLTPKPFRFKPTFIKDKWNRFDSLKVMNENQLVRPLTHFSNRKEQENLKNTFFYGDTEGIKQSRKAKNGILINEKGISGEVQKPHTSSLKDRATTPNSLTTSSSTTTTSTTSRTSTTSSTTSTTTTTTAPATTKPVFSTTSKTPSQIQKSFIDTKKHTRSKVKLRKRIRNNISWTSYSSDDEDDGDDSLNTAVETQRDQPAIQPIKRYSYHTNKDRSSRSGFVQTSGVQDPFDKFPYNFEDFMPIPKISPFSVFSKAMFKSAVKKDTMLKHDSSFKGLKSSSIIEDDVVPLAQPPTAEVSSLPQISYEYPPKPLYRRRYSQSPPVLPELTVSSTPRYSTEVFVYKSSVDPSVQFRTSSISNKNAGENKIDDFFAQPFSKSKLSNFKKPKTAYLKYESKPEHQYHFSTYRPYLQIKAEEEPEYRYSTQIEVPSPKRKYLPHNQIIKATFFEDNEEEPLADGWIGKLSSEVVDDGGSGTRVKDTKQETKHRLGMTQIFKKLNYIYVCLSLYHTVCFIVKHFVQLFSGSIDELIFIQIVGNFLELRNNKYNIIH